MHQQEIDRRLFMQTSLKTNQVMDDKDLLLLMMQDFQNVGTEYKWTNFWHKMSETLYEYLLNKGLRDFRRNNDPHKETLGGALRPLGATDLFQPGLDYVEAYNYVSEIGKKAGAKLLKEISISDYGNPEDLTYKDGCYFTFSWLNFYLRYSYVSQFFKFDDKIIVELGSGSGKQAEMIKKAHPTTTILIFDIIPQLYIQNQYLKAVFPNDVIDYYETRELSSLKEIQKGKIYIFSNAQFPLVKGIKADLFWNTASFQEMEPKIVENYLSMVQKIPNIYLMQRMEGQFLASNPRPGESGVFEKVTLENYKNWLSNYKLLAISKALSADKFIGTAYSDSFWQILNQNVENS
jgi:putative sugar O-methyltransferase